MEHGLVPIEFDMLITHSSRNVIKQMMYESGVREKSRIETIEESSFFLLCLSMPYCLDQLRTLIYPCEMEEGHGELGSRKYTQSL